MGDEPCLVRSTEFDYDDLDYSSARRHRRRTGPSGQHALRQSFIRSVTQSGFLRDADEAGGDVQWRQFRHLPGSRCRRSSSSTAAPRSSDDIYEFDTESLENLPAGLDGTYRWVDLDGEGSPGS